VRHLFEIAKAPIDLFVRQSAYSFGAKLSTLNDAITEPKIIALRIAPRPFRTGSTDIHDHPRTYPSSGRIENRFSDMPESQSSFPHKHAAPYSPRLTIKALGPRKDLPSRFDKIRLARQLPCSASFMITTLTPHRSEECLTRNLDPHIHGVECDKFGILQLVTNLF